MPLGDHAAVGLRGLRVAVQTDGAAAPPTAETVAVVERAAGALRDAGAAVERARHPGGGHDLTIDVWRSYGAETSAAWLYRLLRRWDAFRTEMLAFAERYGAILCPVFGGPAPLHGTIAPPGQLDPTGFTTPHSLTGWPAATVRCGSSPEGLPIGVQVVARPWRDDVALALALRLERDLGGYVPPAL